MLHLKKYHGTGELVQLIEVLSDKCGTCEQFLRPTRSTWWKEKIDFCGLSFDLLMNTVTCMHAHIHTQTYTVNKLRCNLKLDLKCDSCIYNQTLLGDYLWNLQKSNRDF